MSKKNKSGIPILIKNSNRKINSEVMSTYEQIKQSGRREGTIEHILNMYKKDISPTSISDLLNIPIDFVEKVIAGEIKIPDVDIFSRKRN